MTNIINTVIVALQGYDGLPSPVPSIETLPGLPSSNVEIVGHQGYDGLPAPVPSVKTLPGLPPGNVVKAGQFQPDGFAPVNTTQNSAVNQSFGRPISF
jgi:hypothetical protein